ncbi:hypothetical protein [Bacillus sp. S/N-304-OC-R1]|uniref:hypothetical protein n=1 Tax=Bacillus sp. S/N-304-OC-R1 TaxID=2758034 RepID=UPI001C8E681E|nr:hypothetical protein [Bacillus sp. S/N-304-OC-R1]MBY0122301.1 hypothetical protein [Bacillus sp. S/N-304-OC-R1]
MNKKKAIKVLSATAIAASAFVATAPAGTQAASTDVQTLVKKAKDAGTVLKWAISTEGSADGKTRPYAQYNAAKAARDAAVAAINKLPAAQKTAYLADIEQNVTLHINRTMAYIDAITAGEKITEKKAALAAQIDKNLIDDNTEAAYHALSTEIRKQAILLDRVYGQTTRDAVRDQYKKSAETVRDSVKYEVSVKIELDLAKKALAANNIADVEKHLSEAAKFMKDVKNDVMKASLVKTLDELEGQLVPAVKSVSAISATQLVVTFNTAIDKNSVFNTDGTIKATFTLNELDGQAAVTVTDASLSADGKTLTLTTSAPVVNRYDVVIDGLKALNGKDLAEYKQVTKFAADTTAPTVLGTEQISANQVKIKFSEPVKAFSNATLTYADGTSVANASVTVTEGATEVVVDLSDAAVLVNKPITVTFIGLQDQAGNLVSPNPATVQITKQQVDGVKPSVSSVLQTGVKTFNIKFSKDVVLPATSGTINTNNVTVSNNTVAKIEKVSGSEYKVTVNSNLSGVQNVTVNAGYADLANQAGDAVTKVVTFSQDTVAPKATSSKLVVSSDNAEYLELTYDKDVTEGNLAISGSYVKDYVTTSVGSTDVAATYASTTSKKVLRVKLSDFATVEGGHYKVDAITATASGVTSLSGVALEKASASFTRGVDGAAANTTKLAAPTLTATNNDTVTVTFTGKVDGASATNIANYKIDGAVIESATLAAYDSVAETQVVTLKLKANSNIFTGVRNITVQNVKALGSSVAMDPFFKNDLSLTENVRPTVTKAVLTENNKITLTFSEAVYDTTNVADRDFNLYVGGTKVATTVTTANVLKSAAQNTLVLTLSSAVAAEDLAKGLSIKAVDGLDVKDVNDNVLTFTSATVTQ